MSTQKTTLPLIHIIPALLLSLILISLSHQNRTSWINKPINTIFTPLRFPFLLTHQFFDHQYQLVTSIPHQYRLIQDLKRQNAQLALDAGNNLDLQKENQTLRNLLSVPVTPDHQILPAKIISLSRFAIINQGSNTGINPGMPAVIDNLLVGIVSSTSPTTSKIQLLTDPDFSLDVITLSQASGKLVFQNNSLMLTNILQKQTISPEEPIYTKGSDTIPSGLLIGTIKSINQNETSVYQSASVTPAITINDQDHILIILK